VLRSYGFNGKAELDPLGQVGIRNEVATEGDQAGIAMGNACLGRVGVEPTGRDNRSPEDLAQLLRHDRRLPFRNGFPHPSPAAR